MQGVGGTSVWDKLQGSLGFSGGWDVPCVSICTLLRKAGLSPQRRKGCVKPGRFYVTLRLYSLSAAACSEGISLRVGKQILKVGI